MTDQTVLPADSTARAADGALIPGIAVTGGQLIDLLEDGAFGYELHEAFRDLAGTLSDIGQQTGQKTKGKVTITIDVSHEDAAFRIASAVKVTKPSLPKPRSILWTDKDNQFSRFPPNQMQMFGVRSVGGSGAPRAI